MKKLIFILILFCGKVYAQGTNFFLQDGDNFSGAHHNLGSSKSGLVFNIPLGSKDRSMTYLLQDGRIVENDKLKNDQPYCQVNVDGKIENGQFIPLRGIYTGHKEDVRVDLTSNPDNPNVVVTKNTSIELITAPSPMPELYSKTLGIEDTSKIIQVKTNESGQFVNYVKIGLVCTNMAACTTVGDFKRVVGNNLAVYPDKDFNAKIDKSYVEKVRTSQAKCEEEKALEDSIERMNTEVFTDEFKELHRKISNAINNNEMTPEKGREELQQFVRKAGASKQ